MTNGPSHDLTRPSGDSAVGDIAANEYTAGSIVRADANDGVMQLYFKGAASKEEIAAMLDFLGRIPMIEDIKTIDVVAEDGQKLGEVVREPEGAGDLEPPPVSNS